MRLAPVCSWTDRFDSPMRLRERVLAESRDAVNSRCIHSILDFSERNGALYVSTYLGSNFILLAHVTTTKDAVSCVLSRSFFKAAHGDKTHV